MAPITPTTLNVIRFVVHMLISTATRGVDPRQLPLVCDQWRQLRFSPKRTVQLWNAANAEHPLTTHKAGQLMRRFKVKPKQRAKDSPWDAWQLDHAVLAEMLPDMAAEIECACVHHFGVKPEPSLPALAARGA